MSPVVPLAGRAWLFGDDIDTDVMAPGLYFKAPLEEMARHCLEAVDPAFAASVRPGDIIVAGRRFGVGSAREQAAMVLVQLGVGAVLAQSFGRIFYRNALNFGLPALFFPAAGEILAGQQLEVEPVAGLVRNLDTGREYRVNGIPAHLMDMVAAGGLVPFLRQRLSRPPAEQA
ncbi:MAG: 3-isopropylmalate dehydratase small subunit [Gammaproteobacteria bacterium]|nr:MAG: 3-isopropylmalate dehydratase small subunit [Gammaproteobacteria bacterium]